jgi:hypothetical protein
MTIARWLSIVFHPFVMVAAIVGAAAAARQTRVDAARSVAVVMLFTIVPLALLMWRQVAFATLAATALALMRSPIGYVLLFALPPLVWSRLTLQRHTVLEVTLGTIIGAGAGVALHYL